MPFRVNIPPATRVLLILLVGLSCTYQAAAFKLHKASLPWIALTPQLSVFYPWVYVTSTFAEHNILTLAIAAATLFYGGKYLERAWGSSDFGKFILVVILVPNVVASILYVLLHGLFGSTRG